MEEQKETKGKLTTEKKEKGTDIEEVRDMLSELPDYVLLHIMKFMDATYAVQTCVLSKRWKDLWKYLTILSFHQEDFETVIKFNKFVSKVLTNRDGSISLHNLHFWGACDAETEPELLNRVMKYAVLHNIQQLTIEAAFNYMDMPNSFDPNILSCSSLTSLELYNSGRTFELPKSLQLPVLKSLHLANFNFTSSDKGRAEPFSACNSLNTLVLQECSLHIDAKVLLISNSNLSSLKMHNTFRGSNNMLNTSQCKIVFSIPNLSSLTIWDHLTFSYHQLSTACDLSFLEEGTIHTSHSDIGNLLQVFANVKTLTLNSVTLRLLLSDLLNHDPMRIPPPCFVRLESLKVKILPYLTISDQQLNKVVKYLLQNSPQCKVATIKC